MLRCKDSTPSSRPLSYTTSSTRESRTGSNPQSYLMENRHNLVRILVVDDEPVWRRLLRMFLKRHLGKAVQVTAVKGYDEARSEVLRRSYDLVSLDLKLSRTNWSRRTRGGRCWRASAKSQRSRTAG